MRGEMLSILGLYNWDPTIFDNLQLPTSADIHTEAELQQPIVELDRQLLIDNILAELAELPLVYTQPDVVKQLIGLWSRINFTRWAELWATMLYKYNPIWNKDGTIVETTKGNVKSVGTGGYTDKKRGSSSDSYSGTDTSQHNVTGYDTNSYSPDTQDTTQHGLTVTHRDVDPDFTHRLDNLTTTVDDDSTTTRRETGNIGVTTTMQMIREQREIVNLNLYTEITEEFKLRFCVMIY